jgi:hypothetical protein
VKKELLYAEIVPALKTLDAIIAELGYGGKGIYISSRTLKEFASPILFIPYDSEIVIPSPEELAKGKVFHENLKGICITPLGLDLASLLETKMNTSLFSIDLYQLQAKLNKAIVGDLEIAQEFKMEVNGPMIHVRIGQNVFSEICSEVQKLKMIHLNVGDPLSSSIACVLAKALGKPVIVDRIDYSEQAQTIDAFYRVLEE